MFAACQAHCTTVTRVNTKPDHTNVKFCAHVYWTCVDREYEQEEALMRQSDFAAGKVIQSCKRRRRLFSHARVFNVLYVWTRSEQAS